MRSARRIVTFGICLVVGIVADSQAGRIEWVPVSATGPHTIIGNEITLNASTGMQVTLELYISNWDVDMDGMPNLAGLQATVDSSSYNNGTGFNLAPLAPHSTSGAFIATNRCTVNQQATSTGTPCGAGHAACPMGEFCVANPAYVFSCCNPLSVLALNPPPPAISPLNYEFGGVAQLGFKTDDGLKYYFGTLILVVPSGAVGATYSIGFINDPNFTFLLDGTGTAFDVTQLVPATIKIPCTLGTQCDDGNLCTLDRCSSNVCTNPARPLGFDCSDGLACNGIEVCDGAKVCSAPSIPCVGLPNATCDESLGCVAPGNFNGDESLDLADWFDFASCLTGPGIPGSSPCIPARMDNGTDVDLQDGASFFNLFTGP